MTESAENERRVPATVWVGRAMSGLFVIFILGASVVPKFFIPEVSEATMRQLGWPTKYTVMIGVIELVSVVLYAVPRTAYLGAVLFMAVLGGAIATQVRIENPLFTNILFGVYLGLFMWGGLWLRDPRFRAIFPIARTDGA